MNWAAHIMTGVVVLTFFGLNLPMAVTIAFLHTVITDVLGHCGYRRCHHAFWSFFAAVILAPLSPYSIIMAPIHLLLDAMPFWLSWPWFFAMLTLSLYINAI